MPAEVVENVVSSVVTTQRELLDFLDQVEDVAGDPAAATCLMFVKWQRAVLTRDGAVEDYEARWGQVETGGILLLDFVDEEQRRELPLEVSMDAPRFVRLLDGVMVRYRARKVCDGVWALDPSLNIPGMLHAYVVLHGVPDPAPWEKRIILAVA
jgi:hypothetical protein